MLKEDSFLQQILSPKQIFETSGHGLEIENKIEKLRIGDNYDMRGKRFLDANIYKYTDSDFFNCESTSAEKKFELGQESHNNYSHSILSASASFFSFGLLGGNVPQEYSDEGVPINNPKYNNSNYNNSNSDHQSGENHSSNRNSVGPGSFTTEKLKGLRVGGILEGIERKLSPFSLRITGKKPNNHSTWTGTGTGGSNSGGNLGTLQPLQLNDSAENICVGRGGNPNNHNMKGNNANANANANENYSNDNVSSRKSKTSSYYYNHNNNHNSNINSNNSVMRNNEKEPSNKVKMYGEILFVNHNTNLLIVNPQKKLQSKYGMHVRYMTPQTLRLISSFPLVCTYLVNKS